MIKKEQRDEIMRRVEEYTDQARLWATRSVDNRRSETRALVDLVAYLDSIIVPEGWKVVPCDPTPEMIEATLRFDVIHNARPKSEQIAAAIYRAMYDASPSGPGERT